MLAEIFAWLTTACRPEARSLGYLREALALRHRSRRCAAAWAPHLQHSRDFLLKAADAGGEVGVVLGSGLLLDVPLAELAARFQTLVLVDMVHLPEVRRQAGGHANVCLLEADVTGVVAQLHALGCRSGAINLLDLERCFSSSPCLPDLGRVTWVASVNLFSQLPLLPLARVERCLAGVDEAVLLRWQDGLWAAHLKWLKGLAPHGCLLADARREVRDGRGELLEMLDYQPHLRTMGHPAAAWSWLLEPESETGGLQRVIHHVQGWSW